VTLLSTRQQQILALVADGLTNPQIAGHLHLSEHTVRSHMNAIFFRLGVHDRAHAVAVAMRAGVLA
jgi:DNA-binding NarL/FixJ family response regulator